MTAVFRPATRDDVPAVVALLADDSLGATRESSADLAAYLAAFDAMQSEAANQLFVAEADGQIIATYQLTFISGLSLRATRRAQIESVRVAARMRSSGIGADLMADAQSRAHAAGCGLIQLTTNRTRADAHRFYDRMGYVSSHVGYKKSLD